MIASIEKASGKAFCRGKECGWRTKIPEGTKCLRIHIYGAGGGATAFFCEKCMKPVLDNFAQVLKDVDKDIEDL